MPNSNTLLDLDAMMDISLGGVEAAPEFVKPETGNYRLRLIKCSTTKREARDKEAAVAEGKLAAWLKANFDYEIVAVHSVAENKLPVKVGSLFREDFNLTEQGLPYFKARVVDLVVVTGGNEADADTLGVRDVLDQFPQMGIEFDCTITSSETTMDNGAVWVNTKVSQITPVA